VGLLGIALAYVLTTYLTRPLVELVALTKKVGQGDLDARARVWWGNDELARLAVAFNDMVANLQKASDARSELLKKLIQAQEEERRRIARELHDQTSQALTSLALGLRTLASCRDLEEVEARVKELRPLVARTLEEIHDLSLALRPSVLDDMGLEAALRRIAADCAAKCHLEVDFQTVGMKAVRLPAEVETTIYRVVQEALTNIVKHARATEVSIILERSGSHLTVIVEDNGIGFDLEAVWSQPLTEKGLGLQGMQERVNLIGGQLTIETAPGRGTTLYVHIELGEELMVGA